MGCGSSKSRKSEVKIVITEPSKKSSSADENISNNNAIHKTRSFGHQNGKTGPSPVQKSLQSVSGNHNSSSDSKNSNHKEKCRILDVEDGNSSTSDAAKKTSISQVTRRKSNHLESFEQHHGHVTKEQFSKYNLFQSINDFRDVDAYALEAPEGCKDSFKSLSNYLTVPFDSDLLKFRAIWRWITSNIEYDTEIFFNHNSGSLSESNNVLKGGKAVCDGYSSVVVELCRYANIKIKKITGYAKGFHYHPGNQIKGTKTNHAWNAVNLKDQWWLCDFTWGAGYVGTDKRFVWNYTEHYFLTDPEEFILDHFPLESEWQLVTPCFTIEQFQKWAKFYKHFFINKLKPLSHKEGILDCNNGEEEIVIETAVPVHVNCKLVHIMENSTKDVSDYCFHYQENNKAIFQARLPALGKYEMKLFCQKSTTNSVKTYDSVACYMIQCHSVSKDCQVFPKTFSSWNHGYVLHKPKKGILPKNENTHFSILAPGVLEMVVCVSGGEGEWLPLSLNSDGLWQGDLSFNSKAEAANVCIRLKGQTSTTYSSMLKYIIQ